MARALKDIDPQQVEKLAGIGCTLEEIAVVLDCNERTLRRRFVRAINAGRSNARASLRRKQWETAMGTAKHAPSATMQIWLGKQLLNQKDRAEVSGPNGGPIEHEVERLPDNKLDSEISKLTLALQGLTESLGHQAEAGDAVEGEDPEGG